jgi:chromosome segregation ATPase
MHHQGQMDFLNPSHALGPLANQTMDELQTQLTLLTESLDRELSTNKLLEQKCEEYLSQLQRSADIIESSREKHALQIDLLNEKLDEAEAVIRNERAKRADAETEVDRLREELDKERTGKREGDGELERTKETIYKKDLNINELKVKLG